MQISLAISPSNPLLSARGYVQASQDLFARWTTAGYPPSASLARRSDTLIRALQAAGVWAKLDMLKLLDPHSALAPGLLDWKNAAYDGSLVGAGTFTQNAGWAGNGTTGYINTGFNPATASSPNYAQDNAYFAIWSNTTGQQASSYAGYFDGTKGVTMNGRTSGGDGLSARINSALAGSTAGGTVTDGSGLFSAKRTNGTQMVASRNGVPIETLSVASSSVANGAFRLGNFGTAAFSTLQFRAAVAGAYLSQTEEAALCEALATFLAGS